ncbi:MAG: hypothetical protein NZ519_11510 [Bacteroidia bacterium]|nr:hypothetical protein [Bacteroidia bacterium]MDW8348358.1 hypothetical protein [Bacteroidia bacterium]
MTIIGLIGLTVHVVIFWRRVKKARTYTKVDGTVIRIEKEFWEGDTDEPGRYYAVPIVEFKIQGVGTLELRWNNEYRSSAKDLNIRVGKKVKVIYPGQDYMKAEIWDYNKELYEFITYSLSGIFLIVFGISMIYRPKEAIIYGGFGILLLMLLLWILKAIRKVL